jgi:hypothetical protein
MKRINNTLHSPGILSFLLDIRPPILLSGS